MAILRVFLSVFGTYAQKIVLTWFVLHETLHRTLFGIYFCVEVVRILNHNHMLEITCYVSILKVFNRFLNFSG